MRICLVTSEKTKSLTPSDRMLYEELSQEGFEVEQAAWSDKSVNWKNFETVIIRSCWDYHLRLPEFLAWVNMIEKSGVLLLNPAPVIKENTNKFYLEKLFLSGLPVVPTLWFNKKNLNEISQQVKEKEWEEVVIKPAVGATSHGIKRIKISNISSTQDLSLDEYDHGLMVQKYLPEIETSGEWSLIFFGREFSHSVIKNTKPGEFRVQYEYGGTNHPKQADPEIIVQAAAIVDHFPDNLLYARIDGVQIGNKFLLMEAELTEPELFISDPAIAQAFVKRLKKLLN